jgi:hypothetical protein
MVFDITSQADCHFILLFYRTEISQPLTYYINNRTPEIRQQMDDKA